MAKTGGFRVYRACYHGDIVRLELWPEKMTCISNESLRRRIILHAKAQGVAYAALEIEVYRSSGMDEMLDAKK